MHMMDISFHRATANVLNGGQTIDAVYSISTKRLAVVIVKLGLGKRIWISLDKAIVIQDGHLISLHIHLESICTAMHVLPSHVCCSNISVNQYIFFLYLLEYLNVGEKSYKNEPVLSLSNEIWFWETMWTRWQRWLDFTAVGCSLLPISHVTV